MYFVCFVSSGVEMPCVFHQVFLDETFKMRVLVLFPPQPDLRSGAELPCVSLRFLDEKFKMYVLFGCFVPSVAQS